MTREDAGQIAQTRTFSEEYDRPKNYAQVMNACDRLRWLLNQAERVVRVDNEDRAAVDMACRLMAGIDNGFDRVRT